MTHRSVFVFIITTFCIGSMCTDMYMKTAATFLLLLIACRAGVRSFLHYRVTDLELAASIGSDFHLASYAFAALSTAPAPFITSIAEQCSSTDCAHLPTPEPSACNISPAEPAGRRMQSAALCSQLEPHAPPAASDEAAWAAALLIGERSNLSPTVCPCPSQTSSSISSFGRSWYHRRS